MVISNAQHTQYVLHDLHVRAGTGTRTSARMKMFPQIKLKKHGLVYSKCDGLPANIVPDGFLLKLVLPIC